MNFTNPFNTAGWVARIATGLWFLLYSLQGLNIAVPTPVMLVLAAIAGIAWLLGL